jgi:hypothetical protein
LFKRLHESVKFVDRLALLVEKLTRSHLIFDVILRLQKDGMCLEEESVFNIFLHIP